MDEWDTAVTRCTAGLFRPAVYQHRGADPGAAPGTAPVTASRGPGPQTAMRPGLMAPGARPYRGRRLLVVGAEVVVLQADRLAAGGLRVRIVRVLTLTDR